MRITTKGRYGLRAVVQLAKNESENPIPIRQIAQAEDLSAEFLEQIFFRLKKAEIITSTRGASGGFRLSRTPEEITILEILDAVGEDINLSPCESARDCERIAGCTTSGLWSEATRLIRDYFEKVTLRDIMQDCI